MYKFTSRLTKHRHFRSLLQEPMHGLIYQGEGAMGIQNHAVSKVFLGFLALGFDLLLHGAASPLLSCSWGQTTPQPPPDVATAAWR